MGNVYKSSVMGVAALCLSASGSAMGKTWLKAESAHFVVYSSNSEANTREYVSRLEAFNKIASNFYRRLAPAEISNDNKPVFYYFGGMDEAKSVSLGWNQKFSVSVSCRDGMTNFWSSSLDIDSDQIESYQFSGLNTFIYNSYDMNGMSNWLSGGLYSYLATADIKDDAVQLGKPSKFQFRYVYNDSTGESRSLMERRDRVPFPEIISGNYSSPKKKGSIPGQNWVIVHYLLTNPEYLPKLYAYVDDYAAGVDPATAWKKDIGLEPGFFDDVLTQYMIKGVPIVTYKFVPLKSDEIAITALVKSTEPVPLLSAGAQICPSPADAEGRVKRLKAALVENPDDAYTQREYARSEVLVGNPAIVMPYLETEVAAHPKDFDAHYLLGRAYLRNAQSKADDTQKNYARARSELGKGYSLNPTYAPLLYYYAKAFADQSGYPNDNTVTAAEAAYDIGKDSDYAIYLGELYARRGLYDDMTNALEAIHTSPDSIYAVISKQIEDAARGGKPKDEIIALFASFTDHPFEKYWKPDVKK